MLIALLIKIIIIVVIVVVVIIIIIIIRLMCLKKYDKHVIFFKFVGHVGLKVKKKLMGLFWARGQYGMSGLVPWTVPGPHKKNYGTAHVGVGHFYLKHWPKN